MIKIASENMSDQLKVLSAAAIAVVVIATTVVLGIAILTAFKNTGLVDNTTVDLFITGLGVFGTFIGVIVIGVIGFVLIRLFRKVG